MHNDAKKRLEWGRHAHTSMAVAEFRLEKLLVGTRCSTTVVDAVLKRAQAVRSVVGDEGPATVCPASSKLTGR